MLKISEITNFLSEIAPPEIAESYDNVGLLVDSEIENCKNVLVSLDTDLSVAKEAKEKGCELIISHHPIIFTPIKSIKSSDCISYLIKNDISVYAMHTNYDAADGGLCDIFLDKIGMHGDVMPIDGTIGRITELKESTTLLNLSKQIKSSFSLDILHYVGDEASMISKVAVCNGGGADYIYDAKKAGADVYISGDFKYHHKRFGYENGISLIEISHYDAEILFIDNVSSLLSRQFGDQINIFKSENNINPQKLI